MIGQNDALTLGGFIALTTLLMGMGAIVAGVAANNATLRERIATLEANLKAHLDRHEHREG